jgi:hypothetical protein
MIEQEQETLRSVSLSSLFRWTKNARFVTTNICPKCVTSNANIRYVVAVAQAVSPRDISNVPNVVRFGDTIVFRGHPPFVFHLVHLGQARSPDDGTTL